MRVIAGRAKGRRLKVPERLTRPSTDRLREALFSILAARLEGATVLDLFAGSGALGIEALSRGASKAVFVESNWQASAVIKENLELTGLATEGAVQQRDVFDLLGKMHESFDLIFADPPYASNCEADLAARLVADPHLPGRLGPNGLLVMEVETKRDLPPSPGWALLDRRSYGSSSILFYGLEGAP